MPSATSTRTGTCFCHRPVRKATGAAPLPAPAPGIAQSREGGSAMRDRRESRSSLWASRAGAGPRHGIPGQWRPFTHRPPPGPRHGIFRRISHGRADSHPARWRRKITSQRRDDRAEQSDIPFTRRRHGADICALGTLRAAVESLWRQAKSTGWRSTRREGNTSSHCGRKPGAGCAITVSSGPLTTPIAAASARSTSLARCRL